MIFIGAKNAQSFGAYAQDRLIFLFTWVEDDQDATFKAKRHE